MSAPKGNDYAKGNKGGNPGFGKIEKIKKNYDKYSDVFWRELGKRMEKGEQWALTEFNKIQVKMIPQNIETDGVIILKWQDGNNDTVQTKAAPEESS